MKIKTILILFTAVILSSCVTFSSGGNDSDSWEIEPYKSVNHGRIIVYRSFNIWGAAMPVTVRINREMSATKLMTNEAVGCDVPSGSHTLLFWKIGGALGGGTKPVIKNVKVQPGETVYFRFNGFSLKEVAPKKALKDIQGMKYWKGSIH